MIIGVIMDNNNLQLYYYTKGKLAGWDYTQRNDGLNEIRKQLLKDPEIRFRANHGINRLKERRYYREEYLLKSNPNPQTYPNSMISTIKKTWRGQAFWRRQSPSCAYTLFVKIFTTPKYFLAKNFILSLSVKKCVGILLTSYDRKDNRKEDKI
jgi:hypothetical protein